MAATHGRNTEPSRNEQHSGTVWSIGSDVPRSRIAAQCARCSGWACHRRPCSCRARNAARPGSTSRSLGSSRKSGSGNGTPRHRPARHHLGDGSHAPARTVLVETARSGFPSSARPRPLYPVRGRPGRNRVRVAARSSRAGSEEPRTAGARLLLLHAGAAERRYPGRTARLRRSVRFEDRQRRVPTQRPIPTRDARSRQAQTPDHGARNR